MGVEETHSICKVRGFAIHCATENCSSIFQFPGGTVVEFIEAFNVAHYEGWLCLMNSILDLTCPSCNRRPRSLRDHQVMRQKLLSQPEWKQDIVVFAWAAMADIEDNNYLRETDMPMWLHTLLGTAKTSNSADIRNALEHLESTLSRYSDKPNAVEASRLAHGALLR